MKQHFDSHTRRRLRANLRRWYARHGRDLPWRENRDAYRVWISEIMLQQTTVTAVVPYFERFLARFPDVAALAAADESDVLRMWEGLGYYSRARNIHKTARKIVTEYGGEFPDEVAALQALPGIGRYTAGAIASFAFDRTAPIVEANTLRLYCRLLEYDGDPRSTAGQNLLWDFAAEILPRSHPGQFNQALMDLGATLCAPADPQCGACPLKSCCGAFRAGRQAEIPRPKQRPEITDVTEAAIAVERDGEFLLCRRPEGGRWAGLWDFPRFDVTPHVAPNGGRGMRRMRSELASRLRSEFDIEAEIGELISRIRHSVTRYRIELLCFESCLQGTGGPATNGQVAWAAPADFDQYPLSVTGRQLADLLVKQSAE